MKKLLVAATLATVLFASAAAPVFAVSPFNIAQKSVVQHEKGKHDKQCDFEAIVKQSLDKNNRDLVKVKQDLDKLFTERKAERDAKLAQLAKEKGVTVDQLKAEFKQKRQERLEKKAAEQGLTKEQLKEQMIQKHQQRMAEMAKNLSLTPEELKQILPAHPAK